MKQALGARGGRAGLRVRVVGAGLLIGATLLPALALAHGLLLQFASESDAIAGRAYYSNGKVAADEWVELVDLAAPAARPVGQHTDAHGEFRFPARNGGRYRVIAHGEEGHRTELEIVAGSGASARLVDDDASAVARLWPPPAWAVIGTVLLASVILVAVRGQRRD